MRGSQHLETVSDREETGEDDRADRGELQRDLPDVEVMRSRVRFARLRASARSSQCRRRGLRIGRLLGPDDTTEAAAMRRFLDRILIAFRVNLQYKAHQRSDTMHLRLTRVCALIAADRDGRRRNGAAAVSAAGQLSAAERLCRRGRTCSRDRPDQYPQPARPPNGATDAVRAAASAATPTLVAARRAARQQRRDCRPSRPLH